MLGRRGLRLLALTSVGLAVLLLTACTGSSASNHAVMTVSPASAVMDVPVGVRLIGLPANAAITVAATAKDDRGVTWTSSAVYRSSAAGQLGLDQAPVSGSYTGSNPMGLFQFMKPAASAPLDDTDLLPSKSEDVVVRLTASAGGRQLAGAVVRRRSPLTAGVTERSYRPAGSGIYATLYLPPAGPVGRHPAVLLFGGSEGGESQDWSAALLASHGYPAMSLAYFAEPGLPATLTDVPLDYFAKALTVLRATPGVDPQHVLVSGISRGSEAALLVGSYFPSLVNGVIAGVPSSVVHAGLPDPKKPAWLLAGKPLPFEHRADSSDPYPTDPPNVSIPVERIRGPVLIDCGLSDAEWASCSYLDEISSRLKAHSFRYPVTALKLDGGHLVAALARYFSGTDSIFAARGGTAATDEPAQAEVYGKVLDLLASLTGH